MRDRWSGTPSPTATNLLFSRHSASTASRGISLSAVIAVSFAEQI
jgi:hypothetical protein